jgi:protein-L-isoaspartate O-methyltransferase
MQVRIEELRVRASVIGNTNKRKAEAAQAGTDAQALTHKKVLLLYLADLRDSGQLPGELMQLRSRGEIEDMLRWSSWPDLDYDHHETMRVKLLAKGWTMDSYNKAATTLTGIFADVRANTTSVLDPIVLAEREITAVPGFYPTPRYVVEKMLEWADIGPGMAVLEPSAGVGDIAVVVRELVPDAQVMCVEQVGSLARILTLKGLPAVTADFLGYTPGQLGWYDRVVMNPPFEKGMDQQHIMAAYAHLREGGKLVTLASNMVLRRGDRATKAFNAWLEDKLVHEEDIPEVAFDRLGATTKLPVKMLVLS